MCGKALFFHANTTTKNRRTKTNWFTRSPPASEAIAGPPARNVSRRLTNRHRQPVRWTFEEAGDCNALYNASQLKALLLQLAYLHIFNDRFRRKDEGSIVFFPPAIIAQLFKG